MQDQLSLASLKLLFYRYKDTPYYPIVNVLFLIIISIVLVLQVVVPQVTTWFSVQKEVETLQGNISTMQKNKAYLASVNKATLQGEVDLVSQAYPFSKDYTAIIAAMSEAAAKSGLPLSEFSLDIGDPNQSFPADTPETYPFTFTFPTDLHGAKRFIDIMSEILPIAAVTSVTASDTTSTVTFQFYYHGYPQIAIDQKKPIKPLTPEENALLAKLEAWRPSTPIQNTPVDQTPSTPSSNSGAFPPPL